MRTQKMPPLTNGWKLAADEKPAPEATVLTTALFAPRAEPWRWLGPVVCQYRNGQFFSAETGRGIDVTAWRPIRLPDVPRVPEAQQATRRHARVATLLRLRERLNDSIEKLTQG